jgi:hypothetical protein
MTDLRSTLGASDNLAKELSGTVNAIDRVVARFDPQARADGSALDMKDLRDAAIETRSAAEKLTILLEKTNELDLATTNLVNRAFWRGLWLVLALIAGLALLRLLPQRGSAAKPAL